MFVYWCSSLFVLHVVCRLVCVVRRYVLLLCGLVVCSLMLGDSCVLFVV